MKRFLKVLLVFILVMGFTACGNSKKASGKVKVYVFEAGGCPYCEAEIEYLESLQNENEDLFEIVRKELYIDHIEWESGKDFELGVKVANAFYEAGFVDATYQATPFVVISDIYAEASYNTDLLDIIKQAKDEGDNDVVSCFEKSDNCSIRKNYSEEEKRINDLEFSNRINHIVIYTLIAGIIIYLILDNKKKNEVKEVKKTEEKPVKKANKKKK